MINPYPYFGYSNIWPRGFKLNDIGRQLQNKFYLINSSNIFLRPLIFQGLINLLPDIDSIFSLTRKKFESIYNFNKSESYPLLYFPNNYIPINSKNTRYLYEIFPLLIFPISLDESIADIWRGYLMQYFAWRIEGVVIYNNTNIFRKKLIKDNFQFNKEKLNFYKLNNILNFLVSHNNENKNSLEIFYDLLDNLIDNGVLKIVDKKIYNAFIRDLINIGYDFSFFSYTKINRLNHFEYLKIKTQFELYIPSSLFIMKNINLKLMNHFFSNKVYKDILLIINYNIDGFLKLNIYLKNLYNTYFPNIIFVSPSNTEEPNTISCEISNNGFYSYSCFKKIYIKYSNFKGYLYINDDLFLKFWELQNLNFSIPWLNQYKPLNQSWYHYLRCLSLYSVFNKKKEWKNKIVSFNGFFEIIYGMSDFYYLPNNYALKICSILEEMYKSKIFLECAIPNSMGILLAPKYQIITINPLWGNQRNNVINYLFTKFDQVMIHPIKFSNKTYQIKIIEYVSFLKAKDF